MNQAKSGDHKKSENTRSKRRARYFYITAATIMILIMFAGFYPYYLRGEGEGGRVIDTELVTLVLIHGGSLTAWMVLFLVQSILVPSKRLRLHMKLGWLAAVVAIIGSSSGFLLAFKSALSVPQMPFWGMEYQQFLFVMLTEVTVFSLFVIAGILFRKTPQAHRAMMLLACLSVLAGATVRIPALIPIFGDAGWVGIFGPKLVLGALFLLVRSLLDRSLDRWFAAGYLALAVAHIGSCLFAVSETWTEFVKAILNT